ncbi:GNAT family N-acetyltransferase [Thiocystis violacea]|uniref:GNAT family N-acetyltransferase n=1 Tax=Thiocystis violacea TaxID=13725 RepID=UPI001F5C014D|nr:GNAT family N-acetyltransferase [Thiocystis violacea]
MPPALTIRAMTRPELDTLIEWAAAEGWNPGLNDAQIFWDTDPEGFIVRPDHRSQGLGRQLWQARRDRLIARLQAPAVIGMDVPDEGVATGAAKLALTEHGAAAVAAKPGGFTGGHHPPLEALGQEPTRLLGLHARHGSLPRHPARPGQAKRTTGPGQRLSSGLQDSTPGLEDHIHLVIPGFHQDAGASRQR